MHALRWAADALEKVDKAAASAATGEPGDAPGGPAAPAAAERAAGAGAAGRPGPADAEASARDRDGIERWISAKQLEEVAGPLNMWTQPALREEMDGLLNALRSKEAVVAALKDANGLLRREGEQAAALRAQELAHAQAECEAAARAAAEERRARASAGTQAAAREAALRAEAEACARALASTRRETEERAAEARRVGSLLEAEAEASEALRAQLEAARASGADGPAGGAPRLADAADGAANGVHVEADEGAAEAAAEADLEAARKELYVARAAVEALERERAAAAASAARHAREGEREATLAARLRALADQLASKQGQIERLESETGAMSQKLDSAKAARRGGAAAGRRGEVALQMDDGGSEAWGARRRGGKRPAPAGPPLFPPGSLSGRVEQAARTVDALSLRAGSHLRRSGWLRCVALGYGLLLHAAALVILAASQRARARHHITGHELPGI